MSVRYKIANQEGIYFITFAVVQWVDAFSRLEYRDILVESLRFCQKNKGLIIHGWCIMTNHVHFIVSSDGKQRLEFVLRDLKKFTSGEIIRAINDNPKESRKSWMVWLFRSAGERNPNNTVYQFWQQDNHPIELINPQMMKEKLDYIHNNPVKAGIVDHPHEYIYSSARAYAGMPSFLELEFLG